MSLTGLLDHTSSSLSSSATPEPRRTTSSRSTVGRGLPVKTRSGGVLGWLIDIFATLAVVILLFFFWQVSWSDRQANDAQHELQDSLNSSWSQHDAGAYDNLSMLDANPADMSDLAIGQPFSKLHIPRLGDNWTRAVVQGVGHDELAIGPGHYPKSQLPGQVGNAAIAGHRDGQGAPFHNVNKLSTCDPIVVETRDRWIEYRVLPTATFDGVQGYHDAIAACTKPQLAAKLSGAAYSGLKGQSIVSPQDVSVVDPVPGNPNEQPSVSLLTLTSCHPIWSNAQRIIIHAVMTDQVLKSSKPGGWQPPELQT